MWFRCFLLVCAAMLCSACSDGDQGQVNGDADSGQCQGVACDGVCEVDEDCLESEVCDGAQCVRGCRFDGACGEGQICEGDACVEGCRDPADCPVGQTCQGMSCVELECSLDSDCGSGARCDEVRCVDVGDVACDSDDDCGYRWSCTAQGRCNDTVCETHGDCAETQWCREGLCEARDRFFGAVSFERRYPAGVSEHVTTRTADEVELGYGIGGGLFDFDGDLDLDVFIGGSDPLLDSPPCIYRNISTPGEIVFESVPEYCGFDLGDVYTAGGVDVDGDGRDELLLLGPSIMTLLRFSPEPSMTNLRDFLAPGDPRNSCTGAVYAATDVDMDGLVDILIGCQPSKTINPEEQQNLAFRQRPDGSFEPMNGENYQDLRDDGAAMAFGIIDVDVDGLLDVVLVNDTFVESGTVANTLSTGGLLFRCPPSQGCIYERRQFAGGIKAWGSFMGVGNIEINGSEEHLYITDWGANRLLNFGDSRTPRDTALTYGVDLAYSQDLPLFAWSVVVDDFDRNGLDDMLVTQGDPSDIKHFTFEHRDVLFLQRGLGDFVEVGQEAGIGLPNHEDSLNPERVSSSRGAVKADLDGDGLLDIIAASLEGHLKIISELPTADNASDRCTLVPRGRVVPSYGFGYAVSPHWTRDFRRRDMQGNMRFGAGPFVLSSVSRGVLRFPSGAEVDFDCQGGPGPIVVEEPDWIEAWREEGVAFVRLEAPWLDGALSFEVALRRPGQEPARIDSDVSVMDGVLVVPLEEGEDGIMVKVNGLWVGRWWAL